MNKTELEEKIKNGESVWVANKYCYPYEVKLTNNHYINIADNKESLMLAHLDDVELIDYLEYIFETKEKAQHYYDHANITHTEQLPFLTWEEFKNGKNLCFHGVDGVEYRLICVMTNNYIILLEDEDEDTYWELTEENFYKAYDECVRLFKGE